MLFIASLVYLAASSLEKKQENCHMVQSPANSGKSEAPAPLQTPQNLLFKKMFFSIQDILSWFK